MFLHRPSASSTKTFSARTEINFMVSSTISENTNIGPTFDVAAEHREEWEHRSQGSYYLFYSMILWLGKTWEKTKLVFHGSGAALPHFGRDGKDADTCFFCLAERFFSHFLLFFAYMSPDFAYCVTCF